MRWLLFYTTWTFILGWTLRFRAVNGDLVIIRKVNKKDVYHKDRFNIRRSKCTDIRQGNKCGFYGGFERSPNNPCKCQCPPRRGTIVQSKKRWKCIGNEDLRHQEGCGFYLLYESSDSYVQILNGKKWQSFHSATSGCNLSRKKASYLSCNGSWIADPYMGNFVDLKMRGFDQVARGYAYQIRIRNSRIFEGKLIKLHLNCKPFGGNPCLLLKMRGNQNCFKRRKSINRIKVRKNFKKDVRSLLPPSSLITTPNAHLASPYDTQNWTLRKTNTFKKWEKYNLSQIQEGQTSKSRREDMEVTAIILTITAVFLGLLVLGLCINLYCSSTRQESFKEKHIFRRVGDRHNSGVRRLRTSSDVTNTSHSLSLNVEVSSEKSVTFLTSMYETEYWDSRGDISASIDHGGVS